MFKRKSIGDKHKKENEDYCIETKEKKVRLKKKKKNRADSLIVIISDTGLHSVIFKTVTINRYY